MNGVKPRYVALCGAPESGKTMVADMLAKRYGAVIVDDGRGLRDACAAFYGYPVEWSYTQEGKRQVIEVCGVEWTVRQLLGDMGKALETKYGDQLMPSTAIARTNAFDLTAPFYVFPSCRMRQGITYHKHHGLVIEIYRPGKHPTNDFDFYDAALVDETIVNDGTPLDLEYKVNFLFDQIFGGR